MASRPVLQHVSSAVSRQCRRQALKQFSYSSRSISRTPPVPTAIRRHASTQTPPPAAAQPVEPQDAKQRAANTIREKAGAFAETYLAGQSTEAMFKECAAQADYIIPQAFERHGKIPKTEEGEDIGEGTGWWYENLGLLPTFSSWCQVTFLHMWMLIVRLRYFPGEYSHVWIQQLTDHLFFEAEHRMNIFHGLQSRALRNTYLKEIHNQWRGAIAAYDEGLLKGDAVLAAAVWRNIFKADDDADWRRVALVVSFVRRALRGLDRASDRTIVSALVRFGNPMNEQAVVTESARGLDAPFAAEDEALLKEILESKPPPNLQKSK